MASWQPPIPAGALYSPDAVALGPGLALLAWCYDQVERDGSLLISLERAAAELGKPYGTVRDWWKGLKGGPFFAEITPKGRQGWLVRFTPRWLDWRLLQHNYPDRRDCSDQEPVSAEISADTPSRRDLSDEHANPAEKGEVLSQFDRRDLSDHESGNKVLMNPDQADFFGALRAPPAGAASVAQEQLAPPTPPPKGRNRDPNQAHPACQLFFERTGYRPNRQQAAEIVATVHDATQWATAVAAWLSRGYRLNDAHGMLDWYLHPDKMTRNGAFHEQRLRQNTRADRDRPAWSAASIDDVI